MWTRRPRFLPHPLYQHPFFTLFKNFNFATVRRDDPNWPIGSWLIETDRFTNDNIRQTVQLLWFFIVIHCGTHVPLRACLVSHA